MRSVLFALALILHAAVGAPSKAQEEREVCDLLIYMDMLTRMKSNMNIT